MEFYVNGTNIIPYLKFGGLKMKRNDIDGTNAGRDLTGTLIRDRVATKMRWDCTTHPMPLSQANELLSILQPEWISVRTDYTLDGQRRTYTCYSNNIEVTFLMYMRNGIPWVNEFTFPIIEK